MRLVVDSRCGEVIRDFEQVALKRKATGAIEIDKPSDGPGADRTHLSDGFGYYLERVFPNRKRGSRIWGMGMETYFPP